MRKDQNGSLAPKAGYLTERIQEMPEMNRAEMPNYVIKEFNPLIDSSCMGPPHWAMIATEIETNYFEFDGFVVIMGTDTMAYASSALSFMLENLGKTIVFTGSQIPFFEVYSDAKRNLLVSVIFAANSDLPEVCICFNEKILRANRSMKLNSGSIDAFDSPNFPPLANLGSSIQEHQDLFLSPPKGSLRVQKKLDSNVIVIKLVPRFDDESIQILVRHAKNLKAIVLQLYGTGNGPAGSKVLLDSIKEATAKGIVVVVISQCLKGGVSLEHYSMGREFQAAGVIPGGDMTTEACTTKLAYLFAKVHDPKIVSKLLQENLRGELTPLSKQPGSYFKDFQTEEVLLVKARSKL